MFRLFRTSVVGPNMSYCNLHRNTITSAAHRFYQNLSRLCCTLSHHSSLLSKIYAQRLKTKEAVAYYDLFFFSTYTIMGKSIGTHLLIIVLFSPIATGSGCLA